MDERLASLLLITVVHSTFTPVNVQENTASNMTSLTNRVLARMGPKSQDPGTQVYIQNNDEQK